MKTPRTCLMAALLMLSAEVGIGSSGSAPPRVPPKDFKDLDPESLGVKSVPARKDARTGFVVGGKNATALIEGLPEINGRTIAALERDMRPGASSEKGFLGAEERLREVMAADNTFVVDRSGLTHQELARHLRVLAAIERWQAARERSGAEFVYHGRRFKVRLVYSRGFQDSPFEDGTKTNVVAILHNIDNGKKLEYSLLVPDMIERYGFYEGEGTPYRVDPRNILAVLDYLKAEAKEPTPRPGRGR